MLLLNEPPKTRESRFVITEDAAYFAPYVASLNKPGTITGLSA